MSDDKQLDNVDQRKLVDDKPHQEGVWTEIGTAEVTVDMFGHAKVHVIREHEDARRKWMIVGNSLAAIAIVTTIYMLSGKGEPAQPDPAMSMSTQAPVTAVVEPVASAVVAPVVIAPPPVVKPQPKAVTRVTPTPSATPTIAKPAEVVKPAAPIVKPKPVVVESVTPPATTATPPALASPIQATQPATAPAKPQGDITY